MFVFCKVLFVFGLESKYLKIAFAQNSHLKSPPGLLIHISHNLTFNVENILVWLKVSVRFQLQLTAFYKIYVGVPWVGSMDTPDPVRKYESCVLSPTLLFRR